MRGNIGFWALFYVEKDPNIQVYFMCNLSKWGEIFFLSESFNILIAIREEEKRERINQLVYSFGSHCKIMIEYSFNINGSS